MEPSDSKIKTFYGTVTTVVSETCTKAETDYPRIGSKRHVE